MIEYKLVVDRLGNNACVIRLSDMAERHISRTYDFISYHEKEDLCKDKLK